MPFVYRVASLDEVHYFGTRREAERCKPYDEEPESLDRVDAAGECNRLNRMVDDAESRLARVRYMLAELLEACHPDTVADTRAGQEALRYITANPLPPADSAERDGGRGEGSDAVGSSTASRYLVVAKQRRLPAAVCCVQCGRDTRNRCRICRRCMGPDLYTGPYLVANTDRDRDTIDALYRTPTTVEPWPGYPEQDED